MHHEQCLAQVQPAVGRGLLKRTCAARSSLAASSCTIAAARGKPFPVRYSPSNAHPRAPGYREPSAVRQCGAHARTAGRRCRRRTRRGRALSSEPGRRDLFRTGKDSFSPRPRIASTGCTPEAGTTSVYCNERPPNDEPDSIAASSYDMATEPRGAGRARPA